MVKRSACYRKTKGLKHKGVNKMKVLKNAKFKVKRAVTLIEMMIVMFLIALIIGVVAYNYQGSLEEGKVFKTKAGIEKVKTILALRMAEDPASAARMQSEWQEYIKQSPLVQNPKSIVKDGWGTTYSVTITNVDGEPHINVTSARFEEYKRTHPNKFANDN